MSRGHGPDDFRITVLSGNDAERAAFAEQSCAPASSRSVTGTLAGLAAGDQVTVAVGPRTPSPSPSFASPGFTIFNLPDGPLDLLAARTRSDATASTLVTDRLLLQRAVNPISGGSLGALDFELSLAPPDGTPGVGAAGAIRHELADERDRLGRRLAATGTSRAGTCGRRRCFRRDVVVPHQCRVCATKSDCHGEPRTPDAHRHHRSGVTMFSIFKNSQSDALAPLADLARSRHGYDRTVFLSELRRDAPTVAAMVEQLLLIDAAHHAMPTASTTHGSASPGIRQDARASVALYNASTLSTTGG